MNQKYAFFDDNTTFSLELTNLLSDRLLDLRTYQKCSRLLASLPPPQHLTFRFYALQVGFHKALKQTLKSLNEDPHCRLVQSFLDLE